MAYDPDFLDRLESLDAAPWTGAVFRYTGGKRRPEQENTAGARWNPPEVAAIYTALDRDTLMAEFEHHLQAHSPRPKRSAFTLYSLTIELTRIVDLRPPGLLESLGVSLEAIAADEHAACQLVGGALNWLERGGLLVPSARRNGGSNLVIFSHRQDSEHKFEIVSESPIPDALD